MEDEVLLEGICKQDEEAYRMVVQKYSRYVAAICIRVAKGQLIKEDIEEISADVFFKLWEKASTITLYNASLKYYLGTMTRNQTINRLEKQSRQVNSVTNQIDGLEATQHNLPEQKLLKEEETMVMLQIIQELGEPDGEIFLRRYFYDDKITHIAKGMSLNESTVRSKLARGKKKLYNLLKKKGVKKYEKNSDYDGQYTTVLTGEN